MLLIENEIREKLYICSFVPFTRAYVPGFMTALIVPDCTLRLAPLIAFTILDAIEIVLNVGVAEEVVGVMVFDGVFEVVLLAALSTVSVKFDGEEGSSPLAWNITR